MNEKRYVLHDSFEPGFYLSGIERRKDRKRMVITTAADEYMMWFTDKEEADTLAELYELEVVEVSQ